MREVISIAVAKTLNNDVGQGAFNGLDGSYLISTFGQFANTFQFDDGCLVLRTVAPVLAIENQFGELQLINSSRSLLWRGSLEVDDHT